MEPALQGGRRPPLVNFEARTAEDRNETIKQGRLIERMVDWVIIRQFGAKDTCEMEAKSWLETLPKDANMDPAWVEGFQRMYKNWKDGQEPSVMGTHVSTWPAINKAQATLLIAADLPTIEDLAAAPESALARIGMGARALQQKARDFLSLAADSGKTVEQLAAFRAKSDAQEAVINKQAEELRRLTALVEGLTAKMAAPEPAEPAPADAENFM